MIFSAIILTMLKIILAAVTAYFIKETLDATRLRKTFNKGSFELAQEEYNGLVTRLDRLENIALIGFSAGILAVYAKLIVTGSHDFSYQTLVFPMIGMLLAGVYKPMLTMAIERRLKLVEREIERFDGKGSVSEVDTLKKRCDSQSVQKENESEEINYEIIDSDESRN